MGDVVSLKDYREKRRARATGGSRSKPAPKAGAPKGEGKLERKDGGENAKEPADDKPSA